MESEIYQSIEENATNIRLDSLFVQEQGKA